MAELRFRVLGPVEVRRSGTPVVLAGRASLNLLAGLLMSANQPVSYDALAGIVWGRALPAHPRAALHSLKSRLHGSLGEGVIQTAGAGYQVGVDEDALDLLRFERLVTLADTAMRAGSPHRAAGPMNEALSLWNPPVLANVQSDALLHEHAGHLAERYLSAQEKRAALRLALGQCQQVITELSRVVMAHPYREVLVGLLMLALYRSHRQADALAAYRTLRQELRDGLGVEPGGALQQLHADILRRDSALDRPDASRVLDAPGARALTLIRSPRASAQDPRDRPRPGEADWPAEQVPRQLPPAAGDFTGRTAELAQILRVLGSDPAPRIVALAGPGGIGKSALAVHAGHQLSPAFPDGQIYLDAGASGIRTRDPAELAADLLFALGIPRHLTPASLPERLGLYRSLVTGQRILLIIDDVSSESQIRELLPPGHGCAVIVCARPRLAGLPGAVLIELGVLNQPDAINLLSQIIHPRRLRKEPGSAAELVRICAGLPLALRIVGARLAAKPHWPLATLACRLRDEHRLLDELCHGDLDVRTTISSSYVRLPACAQEMLRRLALLEIPDVPLRAGAARPDRSAAEAEALCEALVDGQLLHASSGPAGPSYHLHGLVRAYARELAAEAALALGVGEHRDQVTGPVRA